jgi:hypothetical protein
MARRRVAELPQGSAFAIVRDAFLHDEPGKMDAIIIEFGMAGTTSVTSPHRNTESRAGSEGLRRSAA